MASSSSSSSSSSTTHKEEPLDWFPDAASIFFSTRIKQTTPRRVLSSSSSQIRPSSSSSASSSASRINFLSSASGSPSSASSCSPTHGIAPADLTPATAQRAFYGASRNAPAAVCLGWYLKRIVQYSGFSKCSLVASLALIDRAVDKNPGFVVTDTNVHRLFLASATVASKFYEDEFYPNSYYARVGGVTATEMNDLEIAFLILIQFDLLVSKPLYDVYLCALMPIDRGYSSKPMMVAERHQPLRSVADRTRQTVNGTSIPDLTRTSNTTVKSTVNTQSTERTLLSITGTPALDKIPNTTPPTLQSNIPQSEATLMNTTTPTEIPPANTPPPERPPVSSGPVATPPINTPPSIKDRILIPSTEPEIRLTPMMLPPDKQLATLSSMDKAHILIKSTTPATATATTPLEKETNNMNTPPERELTSITVPSQNTPTERANQSATH
ncbi:Cyclin P/U [Pelomyxa schiedti]|nr:Cyclin P/U [Pelomyxa schiedti]